MSKTKYIREKTLLIDYLKNNDYSLYSKSLGITAYYWIHKNADKTNYRKEYDSSRYSIAHSSVNIIGEEENSKNNIKQKYLLEKWKEDSFKDKEYFEEIDYCIHNYEKNSVLNFISLINDTPEKKLKLIENLPISILELPQLTIEKLKTFVDSSNYKQEEKDKFYLKFFKLRKNQLKDKVGEEVEMFLMSLYRDNQEKLEPYFSFFPNIKNNFNDIELNIEEPGYVIFSLRLNIRKAAKQLSNMSEVIAEEWIRVFSGSMAKKYNLWCQMENIDKPKAIHEIRFYKSELKTEVNEKVSIENYQKTLKSFLVYMSKLSEKPNINFEYVEKWMFQKDLKEKLESKDLTLINLENVPVKSKTHKI